MSIIYRKFYRNFSLAVFCLPYRRLPLKGENTISLSLSLFLPLFLWEDSLPTPPYDERCSSSRHFSVFRSAPLIAFPCRSTLGTSLLNARTCCPLSHGVLCRTMSLLESKRNCMFIYRFSPSRWYATPSRPSPCCSLVVATCSRHAQNSREFLPALPFFFAPFHLLRHVPTHIFSVWLPSLSCLSDGTQSRFSHGDSEKDKSSNRPSVRCMSSIKSSSSTPSAHPPK